MAQPLVSIVIPVYNGADYLNETIESALAQTYEPIEVIVVNDGSTDGGATAAIAKQFGDRIRYFEKENGGVSTALNLGIEKMRGEWFSWLSHDDLYTPEKIAHQIKLLDRMDNKQKTILSCGTDLIDEVGRPIQRLRKRTKGFYTSDEMFDYLMLEACLSGCALLVPKQAFEEAGMFPTNYRYIQDWVLWVDMALAGYEFLVTTNPYVKSRVHPKQQTKRISDVAPIESRRFFEQLLKRLESPSKQKTVFRAIYRSTAPDVREELMTRYDGHRLLSYREQRWLQGRSYLYHRALSVYRGVMDLRYR
ncbi:glycosyltransferase family 2 protein [Exiguobacterium sp. USCH10]|jgi:glycosyltransferase involved in cell wall biosynthesis|uniref:glycosyltransferase family 2 protein n=1 Tax=Exiguobacterium sp. USCH10 TaxID=3024839 RepID=UPI0030AEC949